MGRGKVGGQGERQKSGKGAGDTLGHPGAGTKGQRLGTAWSLLGAKESRCCSGEQGKAQGKDGQGRGGEIEVEKDRIRERWRWQYWFPQGK